MSINSNINQIIKQIENVEKKQIPYATSVALNNTAEIAMKDMKNKIDKDFNITSPWNKVGAKHGIKKKRATKKNLEVEIFIPDTNTWLEDHEDGDKRSGLQLIPTRLFKEKFSLTTNRSIKKKAQTLLNNKSKYRIFEAESKGVKYIFQREKGKVDGKRRLKSKKTGKLLKAKKVLNRKAIPLFIIKNNVKQNPILEFEKTIISSVNKNFSKEFSKAFEYAMRTAK